MRKFIVALLASVAFVIGLSACDSGGSPDPQNQERERQQSNYERLTANQPAKDAKYSPTRETINFWLETWGNEPGKLAYVYLQASNGQYLGYIIFEGLPVSYCASLTPTYRWENPSGDGDSSRHQVPAPAMDGVYYSGAECAVYYGKEAITNAYREFSVGNGINFLLSDQPLPREDVEPLYVTTVEDVN